ncbi:MAG TPA: gluconeogenesis factor YvcK family protein [Candidatus Paceibacterota bacterium]
MISKNKLKIVVIGGGTGTFTVLSGLKKYRKKNSLELSAVVSMADDGGSTGILRDELGVLPPGDIRQCLVALSTSDKLMRELMNYRFDSGTLKGHSFGNLLLSALEKVTGNFGDAVEKTSEILRCEGKVIPTTLDKVSLIAELRGGKKIIGQKNVFLSYLTDLSKIYLSPNGRANPSAVKVILDADAVIIGPGEFYTSIIPNLLVKGIREALQKTKAKKFYVCNLMKRKEHTNSFTILDFVRVVEKFIGCCVDFVIFNNKTPGKKLMNRYAREGEFPVSVRKPPKGLRGKKIYIGGDLLNKKIVQRNNNDLLKRNLIRHNPDRLAKLILSVLNRP